MGSSTSKAPTVAEREAKNWVSCSAATSCNTGWACCNSFTLSNPGGGSRVTTAGNIAKICVDPGLYSGQVPSNIATYGGRFFFCSLVDAKAVVNGAQSLASASALAVTATYLSI